MTESNINIAAARLEINPKSVRRALRRLGYTKQQYQKMTPTQIVGIINKRTPAKKDK